MIVLPSDRIPLPGYDVTVSSDGSWHSGVQLYPTDVAAKSDDLQSLFEYLVERGRINKDAVSCSSGRQALPPGRPEVP